MKYRLSCFILLRQFGAKRKKMLPGEQKLRIGAGIGQAVSPP